MAYQEKPIGEIELVGRVGYQIFTRVYFGKVKFRAKFGIPKENPDTGETYLIPVMEDDSTRDYIAACQIVAPLLEDLRNSAFRERTLKNSSTISSLEPSQQSGVSFEEEEPQELKLVNE